MSNDMGRDRDRAPSMVRATHRCAEMGSTGATAVRRHWRLTEGAALLWCLLCVLVQGANSAFGQTPLVSPPFTIASAVTPANSDTTIPGRPAVASDGTDFLVVSCREIGAEPGVFGTIVSRAGVVLTGFALGAVEPVFGCQGQRPAVTFDGSNYLVVFSRVTGTGSREIVGNRVSPSGMLLDGADGFSIPSDAYPEAIAFDGENYLFVGVSFDNSTLHDIVGAKVTQTGQVLDEFPIFVAPGGQVMPAVAFDGANYLVVWSDTRSGSAVGPDADIYGTRVTPAGVVLDPAGIPISTGAGPQASPGIAFDGTNYFVVWEDSRNGPGDFPPRIDIFGTLVSRDGTVLDGPPDTGGIAINTVPVPKQHPVAAFDGTQYLVVWEESFFYDPPGGIFAARVSRAGELLDSPADAPGLIIGTPSCFTCRFVFPSIAASGETLFLAWVNNTEVFDTAKDVVGVIVSPPASGAVAFARFDADLALSRTRRGEFFVEGFFTLGEGSDGVQLVAEPVAISLADTDGIFFTQTLPPGSLRRTKGGAFVFLPSRSSAGIRFLQFIPAKGAQEFRFIVLGVKTNLRAADRPPLTVTLELGNDSGSQETRCHAFAAFLICK